MEPLPSFRYHPDPIASGSVVESTTLCRCCQRVRGFVYVGPVFAHDEIVDDLCPWCIADRSAAAAFGAQFTDVDWGVPDDVPAELVAEVAERTPGFTGWQQEHWLYHCGAPAAFLGRVGFEELSRLPDALDMVTHENDGYGWSPDQSAEHVRSLHPDGDATAYLFRCLACGTHLAYTDMS
jgi:hypothetical protein